MRFHLCFLHSCSIYHVFVKTMYNSELLSRSKSCSGLVFRLWWTVTVNDRLTDSWISGVAPTLWYLSYLDLFIYDLTGICCYYGIPYTLCFKLTYILRKLSNSYCGCTSMIESTSVACCQNQNGVILICSLIRSLPLLLYIISNDVSLCYYWGFSHLYVYIQFRCKAGVVLANSIITMTIFQWYIPVEKMNVHLWTVM